MRSATTTKIVAAYVLASAVAMAQPAPPTAAVSGTVLDPTGGVIAGAKVSLIPSNGKPLRTKTDLRGEFHFEAVAPGRYELLGESSGFALNRTRLNVGARSPSHLRIVMAIAEVTETLNVEGSREQVSTDAGENVDAIRLGPQQLENLAIIDRDVMAALLRLLGPATEAGGASLTVDGMPTSERGIPLSEIQQVIINSNPYSAEFARPGKVRVEIITKSGSLKYHGSFYFGLRDYRLDARNAFAIKRPPQQRGQLDTNLSGPLLKDQKSTFSLNISRIQDHQEPNVYAFGLDGPILENASRRQTTTYFSAQYTRRLGENALSFRYSDFDWSDKGQGTGGFVLPEAGASLTSRYHQLYSSYRTVIRPKLLNEFSMRARSDDSRNGSLLSGVRKIVVTDAFTAGGAQVDTNGTNSRLELADILSWSHGRHLLRGGASIPGFGRVGLTDHSNLDGTFYFSSLRDYALGTPFSYIQQAGRGHVAFWQKQVGGFAQDEIKLRQNLSVAAGLRYDWQNYGAGPHNFAPRLTFAYAPRKAQKTVFRGGAGFFYDAVSDSAIADTLLLDGNRLHQIQLLNPIYPNPLSGIGSVAAFARDIVRFSPALRSPYTFQYSFGVERQLRKSLTLSTTYTTIRGVDLYRSRDVNAPLPPLYTSRPDPFIGVFRQIESSGGLKSHALRATLRGDLSRFFNGMMIYELGRTMNDTNGIGSFPANNWDPRGEWSRSSLDTRHFMYLYGTLNAGRFLKFGVIFSANSGLPYTLTTGLDNYHDGMTNARPPGVSRNSLQGTGAATVDLRWSKALLLHWRGEPSLVAGVDAFNVFNRVNYETFTGNQSSPFFGEPVSAGSARRMQVSITLKF
jgi:hypothetical protein